MKELTIHDTSRSSLQDVFDYISNHLLTQAKQARQDSGLSNNFPDISYAYRTTDGLTCAIGCLIPADEYTESIEGCCTEDVYEKMDVRAPDKNMLHLLDALQSVHDESAVTNLGTEDLRDHWRNKLQTVAEEFNLSKHAIDNHIVQLALQQAQDNPALQWEMLQAALQHMSPSEVEDMLKDNDIIVE